MDVTRWHHKESNWPRTHKQEVQIIGPGHQSVQRSRHCTRYFTDILKNVDIRRCFYLMLSNLYQALEVREPEEESDNIE